MSMSYGKMWPIYRDWWDRMEIKPSRMHEFEGYSELILSHKAVYAELQQRTNVPRHMIGVLHLRESNCNMGTHLHNGDTLRGFTHNVPAGRPKVGHGPPFTFIESAVDALTFDRLKGVADWRLEKVLYYTEEYNGEGYHNHGDPSPYVFGGTNIQVIGKYVRDRQYVHNVWDTQPGCAPILQLLMRADPDPAMSIRES